MLCDGNSGLCSSKILESILGTIIFKHKIENAYVIVWRLRRPYFRLQIHTCEERDSLSAPQEKRSIKTKSPSSNKYILALAVSSIISNLSIFHGYSLIRICSTFCSHPADCLPASPFRRARGGRHPTRPAIPGEMRNLEYAKTLT